MLSSSRCKPRSTHQDVRMQHHAEPRHQRGQQFQEMRPVTRILENHPALQAPRRHMVLTVRYIDPQWSGHGRNCRTASRWCQSNCLMSKRDPDVLSSAIPMQIYQAAWRRSGACVPRWCPAKPGQHPGTTRNRNLTPWPPTSCTDCTQHRGMRAICTHAN